MTLDVDYQRGHVWTQEQQAKFIGHLLEGGDAPRIIVNSGEDGNLATAEILDGKQRITAAIEWQDSRVPALLYDEREVWAADLEKYWQVACRTLIGMKYAMVRCSRVDALELYVRLNRGGTPHTDEEIQRVKDLLQQELGAKDKNNAKPSR